MVLVTLQSDVDGAFPLLPYPYLAGLVSLLDDFEAGFPLFKGHFKVAFCVGLVYKERFFAFFYQPDFNPGQRFVRLVCDMLLR